MTMKVRLSTEGDIPAIEDIFHRNRGPAAKWLNPNRPPDCWAEQSEGETVVLAESEGVVCGFASVWAPENFIHHLYVHPTHQGQGVGKLLVEEAARRFPGDLTLKCVTANQQAMAFYQRTGWIIESTGEGPDGEYTLLKLLNPE